MRKQYTSHILIARMGITFSMISTVFSCLPEVKNDNLRYQAIVQKMRCELQNNPIAMKSCILSCCGTLKNIITVLEQCCMDLKLSANDLENALLNNFKIRELVINTTAQKCLRDYFKNQSEYRSFCTQAATQFLPIAMRIITFKSMVLDPTYSIGSLYSYADATMFLAQGIFILPSNLAEQIIAQAFILATFIDNKPTGLTLALKDWFEDNTAFMTAYEATVF